MDQNYDTNPFSDRYSDKNIVKRAEKQMSDKVLEYARSHNINWAEARHILENKMTK